MLWIGLQPARLCGYDVPPPVLSSSSVMLINFQSDENGTFRGFQAAVSFIPIADLNTLVLEDGPVFLETWNVPSEEINASE
ncbi:Hypothetical predicted protein [Marmota monax]|uniref:CUB domain-containing protein n=1 Tax=Marmota monax TaxID=9995 RepID=A0A5E4CLD6_MARMO|nr:Hypothetical predicted protein [Marmota monax]